jgi:hypothetical protein
MTVATATAPTSRSTGPAPMPCLHCDGVAHPEGPPAVLTGSGKVELQQYRCERTPSHWWHQDRVLV